MKILFVTDKFLPEQTTVGKIVATLGVTLQKKGHEVYVVTSTRQKKEVGEEKNGRIRVFRIYSDYHERWRAYLSLYNPKTVKKFRLILDNLKPNIVHFHNIHYHLSYYCFKLAKQSGAKVFLTAHDVMLFHYGKLTEAIDPSGRLRTGRYNYRISPWQQLKKYKCRFNPFYTLVARHYLGYVDKVFSDSNDLKYIMNQNGIGNVDALHTGLNLSEWTISPPALDKFREKYKLRGKKVVLFGGRLSEAKGGRQIILVMKKVIDRFPDATLLIMGERNRYAEQMFQVAKGLSIEKHLVFTGWVCGDELKAAYHASNIICVLSLYPDPFPTINLEAMACGKPVIGTCFGGTSEAVLDGRTGFIVNPFDIETVVWRISDLLADASKAEAFGMAGYERLKKKFTAEKAIDEFLKRCR